MKIFQLNGEFKKDKELLNKNYSLVKLGIEVFKNNGNLNSNFKVFINEKSYVIGTTNILEIKIDNLYSIKFNQNTLAQIIIRHSDND